jgi:hypothetical protein
MPDLLMLQQELPGAFTAPAYRVLLRAKKKKKSLRLNLPSFCSVPHIAVCKQPNCSGDLLRPQGAPDKFSHEDIHNFVDKAMLKPY